MRTGIILSWCALAVQRLTVVAVGNAPGIVPYAEDQQLIMKVNVNFLSDQPEQYVAGQLTVLGHGARVPGGQLQFEIVRWPKYGQIGWNNSVSGEFVYSPRELSIDTSNHGVEALVPVPGCKYGCGSCPNAAGAHLGPSQPVPDPNATEVCNGRSTRCNGYRSTLRDPDFPGIERYVPLASREQEGWVNGYTCPEAPEQDQLLYRKAKSDNRLEMMDQDVRQRVECKSVPARGCVMHSATVPRDTFSFHVRNQFGVSNIATVTVEFDHNDQADMTLEFTFLTGFLMMLATCTGLLRIIVLQTLLHPYREYNWIPAAFSNAFCPVPEPAFKRPRDPSDYKPEFMKELALAWPPPGYHERRDAAAASRRPTQQLIPDVPHRSPIATRSKSRREAQIEKVDNALRRSLSRLVATASSGGQEAGDTYALLAPCRRTCAFVWFRHSCCCRGQHCCCTAAG